MHIATNLDQPDLAVATGPSRLWIMPREMPLRKCRERGSGEDSLSDKSCSERDISDDRSLAQRQFRLKGTLRLL